MKAFKSAMKLIVESQIAQPVDFKINKNTSEFVVSSDMWRLVVPIQCESDIENTTIKLTNETFNEIYKGLRSVKKDFEIVISEDHKLIKFVSKDESLEFVPTAIVTKEVKAYQNDVLTTFKIDDMLSFLNSVFAFRNNKFTPIDAQVEIRFDHDSIRFLHFTSIKMSKLALKNIQQKEYRTITIPTKQMNVAFSLFKNSLEFDGEIQENDNVLIFATNRFKLGLKKEHKETKPLEQIFQQNTNHEFKSNDEFMNQIYSIKKALTPLTEIKVGEDKVCLEEAKIKPSKDDIMVQILKTESGIQLKPYLNRSCAEIGAAANGSLSFYDLSHLYEISQSFIEPGFVVSVLENSMLKFSNVTKTVLLYLLPITPFKREVVSEE